MVGGAIFYFRLVGGEIRGGEADNADKISKFPKFVLQANCSLQLSGRSLNFQCSFLLEGVNLPPHNRNRVKKYVSITNGGREF